MPPENGVRRHDRRDLRKKTTLEAPANDGETSPFVITESHPPTVQLPLQHTVFCVEECDHVALLAVQLVT
jgi:hypothetical protein